VAMYMTREELQDLLQISTATLWRWSKTGHLPKPLKIGPQVVRWRRDEVLAMLDAKQRA